MNKIVYSVVVTLLVVILGGCTLEVQNAIVEPEPQQIHLSATLSAPNQNGTNPDFVTDEFGVVPSESSGEFSAILDLESNQLLDISLNVFGISIAELRNFGPNATPFHIHLPNSGNQGDFGFNVIDLLFDAEEGSLVDTENGFSFTRASHSILAGAQGKYEGAGVYPGDDVIAELLQNGFPFILVHSSKDIFTNTNGKFPNGDPVPVGFPFGELRGEISVDGAAGTDKIEESEVQQIQGESGEEDVQLVTATATAEIVQDGRVLMHARNNRWIFDSVPPLGGPNEEVNPLDGILTALISCGMFIYEAVGIEEGIEINNLSATVQGELDGRGVTGAPVNPRIRTFHITMNADGPTPDEAMMMAEAFSTRCPIYTTLARSADINVINVINVADGVEQEPFSTQADPIVDNDLPGEELDLSMPSASGRMIEFGRSLMIARGNRWLIDSVPPLGGPNEEVNPLDMFIGTVAACSLMFAESTARDEGIPLHSAKAIVEADLDPRGVAGADVDPRIRAFRVNIELDGPTAEDAETMAEAFSTRCPIYTTLERSAPIELNYTMLAEEEMGVTDTAETVALAVVKAER